MKETAPRTYNCPPRGIKGGKHCGFLLVALALLGTVGCATKPGGTTETKLSIVPTTSLATLPAEVSTAPGGSYDTDDTEPAARIDVQDRLGLVDVHFDFDRAELKPEVREHLVENARYLSQEPEVDVTIEGHCDERGTNEYNLALGYLRASVVRDFLHEQGVAPDRLEAVSFGEERASCSESRESCWWRNRRAAFKVVE